MSNRRCGVLLVAAALALGMPAPAQAVDSVRILALFKGKAMLQIDGTRRLLSAGQVSPEGVGLISANAREAVLEIDGRRIREGLGQHISSHFTAASRRDHVVHIAPDTRGMYIVNGAINGMPVRYVVDTGASSVAMNRDEARRLGLDFLVSGKKGYASTASGVVPSFGVTLRRVRVGDIVLRDVPAIVIDSDHPPNVLLGMSFLSRIQISHDGKIMVLIESRP